MCRQTLAYARAYSETQTCMVLWWCLQTLFVQRLHEVEAAGDAPSSSAPTGLPQKELLSWYFDKMVERCLLQLADCICCYTNVSDCFGSIWHCEKGCVIKFFHNESLHRLPAMCWVG